MSPERRNQKIVDHLSLSIRFIHRLLIAEVEYKSRNVLADADLRTAIKDYRYFVFY